jgi:hypothetical protein
MRSVVANNARKMALQYLDLRLEKCRRTIQARQEQDGPLDRLFTHFPPYLHLRSLISYV